MFTMPRDLRVPMVMVGPGTGVAPFIAMLQHRRQLLRSAAPLATTLSIGGGGSKSQLQPNLAEGQPHHGQGQGGGSPFSRSPCSSPVLGSPPMGNGAGSETHLFFGCRGVHSDYLFRQELNDFLSDGTLSHLHLALSQDKEDGRWYGGSYVQDKLLESSIRICHLLLSCKAHFYVCGDGVSMAREVKGFLQELLMEVEHLTADEAADVLAHLVKMGRYHDGIY